MAGLEDFNKAVKAGLASAVLATAAVGASADAQAQEAPQQAPHVQTVQAQKPWSNDPVYQTKIRQAQDKYKADLKVAESSKDARDANCSSQGRNATINGATQAASTIFGVLGQKNPNGSQTANAAGNILRQGGAVGQARAQGEACLAQSESQPTQAQATAQNTYNQAIQTADQQMQSLPQYRAAPGAGTTPAATVQQQSAGAMGVQQRCDGAYQTWLTATDPKQEETQGKIVAKCEAAGWKKPELKK